MKYTLRRINKDTTATPIGHVLNIRHGSPEQAETHRQQTIAPENWEVVGVETKVTPMKKVVAWVPDDRAD